MVAAAERSEVRQVRTPVDILDIPLRGRRFGGVALDSDSLTPAIEDSGVGNVSGGKKEPYIVHYCHQPSHALFFHRTRAPDQWGEYFSPGGYVEGQKKRHTRLLCIMCLNDLQIKCWDGMNVPT